MRRWVPAIALALLWAGCGGKHEAKTGKDFLEKMKAAAKDKDADTLWKMYSKASQEDVIKRAKDSIERAKKDEKVKKRLQDKLGKDPTSLSPEELAKLQLKKALEKDKGEFKMDDVVFVKETKEGDLVILVTKKKDKEESEIVLVKEGGYLKWDMKKTTERVMEKWKKK